MHGYYKCTYIYNIYIYIHISLSLSLSLCMCLRVFVCVCVRYVSMAWHVSQICFRDLQASFDAEIAKSTQKPLRYGKPMPHVCKHNCREETRLSSKAIRLLSPRYVCMQLHHMWHALLRRTFLISSSATTYWSRRK